MQGFRVLLFVVAAPALSSFGKVLSEPKLPTILLDGLEFVQVERSEETTAGVVWEAGHKLATKIMASYLDVRGKHLLELGSGTGIVGAVAATHGADRVVFSDMAIELLSANLETNMDRIREKNEGVQLYVTVLRWGNMEDIAAAKRLLAGCLDYILAADLVYVGFNLGALFTTLIELSDLPSCSGSNSRPKIIMTYHERSSKVTRTLESALQQGHFTWQREAMSDPSSLLSSNDPFPGKHKLWFYEIQAPECCSAYAGSSGGLSPDNPSHYHRAAPVNPFSFGPVQRDSDSCHLDSFHFQVT
eukprot:gb/GEZN01013410.1/.p1 GENE.gb/GEZN01013410.1/~~gb/GEZN01013410.1/.p1  ORF type:complete len:302 (+),score=20.27 gb/GEZN01013410.1/:37-942(+)